MIFTTWSYALFLAVCCLVYWVAPARWRPYVLLAFGFVFYVAWYAPHVILIAATIPLVHWASLAIARHEGRGRRGWLALGTGACLATLAYYKYTGFLVGTAASVAYVAGLPFAPHVVEPRPPLGVSFFVFEYVHYLIEIYRGTFAPARLRDLALFVMFFPTLICGPIKRFQLFRPQEYAQGALRADDVHVGLERIVFGLAKKILVADQLAPYTTSTLMHHELYGWGALWLATYGYALQIYFDFAGYSDIAIGSARLLGYTVPENFDRPYRAANIARFWRCWHMSLTSWITDYVYIPLGGNRHGERRAAANRLVSMTLCGLWHGAAWHFVAWGAYHGVMLNLYRAWMRLRPRLLGDAALPLPGVRRAVATVFTFHVVCIGWVLFVCDVPRAAGVIARLLGLG